jgi:hypothetical protein
MKDSKTFYPLEKLQAIASPWAQWIASLEQKHVLSDGGLSAILDWDTSRGRDFQCIAQMVYCCDGLPDYLLPTAQKLEKWLVRVDPPTESFMSRVDKALSEFWYLASNKGFDKGLKGFDKRVAPVEFVFIGTSLPSLARSHAPKLSLTLHVHKSRCAPIRHARLLAPRPRRSDIQHAYTHP